ncbi:MAG: PAS domain S-box protein [Desulfocapsaceae bacterium]|nr:PAS domain S-box protein [Desulfocapsaceae bacterium]
MKKGLFFLFIICFVGLCAYLFIAFYDTAEKTAIRQLNDEQQIHAQQAAQGIGDFFTTWAGILNSFSKMDEIISIDDDGKRYLTLFYEAHQEQIRSITRVDERGRILYTVPNNDSAGNDISNQKHMQEILRDQKSVVSDVFRAVQGFYGIALHVPVFQRTLFKGTIAIVIDFENLAKRYLEVIKIGKTGYAWVVGRDGTTLYSPVPGFTGKSIFDNCRDFPQILSMVGDMLQGHQGTATYTFNKIGDQTVTPTKKFAVYMPIHIVNSFWSIVVASSEDQVLSSLASFRNKLFLVIGLILFGGVIFTIIGAKAWMIIAEEKKRRRVEEELRQSQQYNRLLFELSPIGLTLCRMDGTLVDINSTYARIIGRSVEETLQLSYWDITPQQYGVQEKEQLKSLEESGQYGPYEKEYIHKEGYLVPVRLRGLIIDKDGEKFIWSSVEDISESKKAEKEMQRNEQVLRLFVEHTPAAIAMFDREMKYIVASRRFLIDYNLGEQDIIGRSHYEVFPDIPEHWKEIHRRCLAGAVEKSGEDSFPRADGKMDWVRWEIHPWYETQGKIGGIILFSEVITERKETEEALRAERDLNVKALDSMPGIFYMYDENRKFQRWNKNFELVSGYSGAEIARMSPLDFFAGEGRELLQERIQEVFATGVSEAEADFVSKDGTRTPFYFTGVTVRYEGKTCLVGMGIDVTERKRVEQELEKHREKLEELVHKRTVELQESQSALMNIVDDLNVKTEELEQANAMLKELDRLKSMFIASMSHELRTPLNSIIGFTGLIVGDMVGAISDEQRDMLGRVSRAGKHLLSLITDVIDIAKIESGKIVPYLEDFDLHALLDEAVGQVGTQAGEKGLTIEELQPDDPMIIHSDRKRLLQCLLNYLSNAVKFSEKGTVTVEVKTAGTGGESTGLEAANLPDGWIEISIKDTGIGIREEDMKLLFGSFVRLETPLKTTTPGTGLGLYLTKKLTTEVLGGTVGAESEEGSGSRFWLRLPQRIVVE